MWHSFHQKLPEDGQAIATIYNDCSVGSVFRRMGDDLTYMESSARSGDYVRRGFSIADAVLEFQLWAALPDDFKLWGEK